MLMSLMWLACSGGGAEESAEPAPTYYADVRPILDATCARCHNAEGIAASFDDPAAAQGLAATMKAYTQSGYMPPPAPASDCRDYASSERFTLTDAQKATIAAWADAGAPLGDAADAPPARDTTLESLAPYDLELWATQPYTPSFSPTDGNDYRCFLIDVGNEAPTYVTALQAMVQNTRIVHHVVLFQPSSTDDLFEQGDPDPYAGFSCGGLGQGNWSTLGAWAPGANPTVLPEGVGLPLPAHAQVILQMHYFNSFDGADQEQDQSGYGLMLADSVQRTATNYAAGPTNFTIPAGDSAYKVGDQYRWPSSSEVLAVWPHMHLLGVGFEEHITHSDGSDECLMRMDGWDFHNQVTANFLEPASLTAGDRLSISCTYDNSAGNPNQVSDPPQNVNFGEGTTDEMCFGFTLVAGAP
jgi:hypothetical protein